MNNKLKITPRYILTFLLLMLIFGLQAWGTHHYLTSVVAGGNDFYSRWHGARVLLLENQDPYDLAVTEEIQQILGATHQAEGRSGFHYPLHVIFLFFPLVFLPYPWVQAFWITTLVWVTVGIVAVMLRRESWSLSPPGLAALLMAVIFFYPVARTIMLGQFTLHVTLFVVLALWAWRNGRYGWAGIAFAATSIKPQMIVLVGIWLVIWTIVQRRWRFIWGVLGGGLGLLLASMLLYLRWPLSFIADAMRYADVAGGRNPLSVLGSYLWGGADGVRYVLSGLIVAGMLLAWWRALRSRDKTDFEWALWWAVVVSMLVPFQTGTTNQALLLVVFLPWVHRATQKWGGVKTAVVFTVVEVGLWALFAATLSGDYENPILFVPLPILSFLVLLGLEWRRWRRDEPILAGAS